MKGAKTKQDLGKIGNSSLNIPYKANFKTIAAKRTLPPNGS